jgi:hypothetical protein
VDRPILLVCDDVALIATVRRLLEREGRESVLATSVTDAAIALSHYAPAAVILDPGVDGNRGAIVAEELSKRRAPNGGLLVLLGREVDGVDAAIVPVPIDGAILLQALAAAQPTPNEAARPVSANPPTWWQSTQEAGGPVVLPAPVSHGDEQAFRSPERAESSALVSPEALTLPMEASGSIGSEELAELLMRLCSSKSSVCLELSADGATRSLWLKDGRLVAASSSLDEESLLVRARADGLLDRQQEKELRHLETRGPAELVRAMRGGGYLREVEVVPLVQRNSEQVALEALSQDRCDYRLSSASPEGRAISAASAAPLLELLPRALRRTMSDESIMHSFGGLEAVPLPRQRASTLRALGLTDPELELVAAVDGSSTVGELLLSCALPQEQALRTLQLARLLRVIDIRRATAPPRAPGPDVDVRRLKSKLDEVQEADYFSILGLPRSAGSDEVRQAFEVLSAEFNPLKFAGHPDPTLQTQAQLIRDLLAEAAQTLQDDRLRAAYATNLVD